MNTAPRLGMNTPATRRQPHTAEPSRLGIAAARLVTVGILIPPLAWLGIILGVVAGDRHGLRAFWCGLLLLPLHVVALKLLHASAL